MRQSFGKLNMKSLFLLTQALLYSAFLILDITENMNKLSITIKYTIILLCLLYALIPEKIPAECCRIKFFGRSVYGSTLFLLQAALFFTAVSDLFILVLDYYLYGVMTFIIVQQLYSARLIILEMERKALLQRSKEENSVLRPKKALFIAYGKRVLLQLFVTVIVYLLLVSFGVMPELLLFASIFYFVCILSNVLTAIYVAFKDLNEKANVLYAVGMFLFLLCDINVGLFNLSGFVSMPKGLYSELYSFSAILMWAFYAPSQVLITLSSKYIRPVK